jgi:homoserine O-acetyltransferase
MIRGVLAVVLLCVAAAHAHAQQEWSTPNEGDFVLRDYRFGSGEVLPELKQHYLTLGTPRRDAAGDIVNAILLLHGTAGSSRTWLQGTTPAELFAPGQPFDATRYFVIIPDSIGSGLSSKPSDGLRAAFPHYRYQDVVRAQHRLLTERLGIRRLHVVAGASMGGMQTWLWGTMYPDFMSALVPIASQPTAMSGRNWIARKIRIEAIKNDPLWKTGKAADGGPFYIYTLPIAQLNTDSAIGLQQAAPTRAAADAEYARLVANARQIEPFNQVYSLEASMDYDPQPDLHKIKAPLLAINFADDEINPPELGVVEPAIDKIAHARYVLVPAGPDTRGHYTYQIPAMWKTHLASFMATLEAVPK